MDEPIIPIRQPTAQELHDQDQWFGGGDAVHKDVRSYATSPARGGMTNPPRSPKVRQELLEHLTEVGIRHELGTRPNWSSAISTAASPRKVPYDFASTSSPVGEVRKRFTGQKGSPRPIIKCGATQVPGAFWRAGAVQDLGRPLLSKSDADESEAWFQQKLHYDLQLKFRNAVTPPAWTINEASLEPTSPTTVVTKKGHRGQAGRDTGSGTVRHSSDSPNSAAKAAKQQMMVTSMSDPEFWRYVHASKEGLLGQNRLHRAAVSDRFRFCADDISHGGLVISGAGMAVQPPPGVWASDAAHLNRFHNSAIRIVAPSGLEPLSANARRRKKRGDDDHLQMSNSGLFKALYPVDNGLKAVRRLRRRLFPDSEGREDTNRAENALSGKVTDEARQFGRQFRSRSISGRYA
mmetsp:Transcript_45625/g.105911  ORF Transcript_45625/g.105911 Transcript_45625/m.105911 type:complete len:406 (+) Transcript_45625:47-1264(+)